MPVSIQAHHSFVDGIHVGKLVARLQEYMKMDSKQGLETTLKQETNK